MKNCLLILLFAFFVLPFNSNAQTTEAPTMLAVFDNDVPPSKVSEFENVVKEQLPFMKKYDLKWSYYIYQTDDNHYWWVCPIHNLNEYKEQEEDWIKFQSLLEKEEGFVGSIQFLEKINSIKPMIFQWLPDVTYIPEGSSPKYDQPQFFNMGMCYIKVGFVQEFLTNQRKWVKLFEDNQLQAGWNFYAGVIGTENPFYMWGETYDSEIDRATAREKAFSQVSEETSKLWNEALQYMRKFETKRGWYRPDLSYIVEN